MSLIGTLEQFNLSSVLQRVEAHTKTGLLTVRPGTHTVELYLRDGRLMCIGPVRTNATLGERLLQDNIISRHALQETLLAVGNARYSETRMALTLMDLGHVSHEGLRAWATGKATEVLQVLLAWTSGDVYFDEDVTPPGDRLLVALSISALLSAIPASASAVISSGNAQTFMGQEEPAQSQAASAHPVPNVPTLVNASDLLSDDDPPPTAVFSTDAFSSLRSPERAPSGSLVDAATIYPAVVAVPTPARYIDTSFMRPDMVLTPLDLSAVRERNPQIQLTPDQWRLLTRVDGCTSLQMACLELSMTPDMVRQVAGELMAENLIQLSLPAQLQTNEFSPVSRELLSSGLNYGLGAPGYATPSAPLWSPVLPSSDVLPQFATSVPFETQSQWGNGGNNASFVPGRGWIASPQPLQPLPGNSPLASTYSDIYAQVGGSHL
ncbi:MAG: DUF4388 domain-containing protein [Chloroflexota bacterium]|nr:DUF4388 domain-containing protein [Chloroflexota bacterium]